MKREKASKTQKSSLSSMELFIQEHLDNNRLLQFKLSELEKIKGEDKIERLTEALSRYEIQFPYKKYYMMNPDVMFENLRGFEPVTVNQKFYLQNVKLDFRMFPVTFRGRFLMIKYFPSLYKYVNNIVDYFNEEERMRCSVRNNVCPLEFWKRNIGRIVREVIENGKDVTTENLRDQIYGMHKECSYFKASTAMSVYKLLKARRIVDISAGWGDRLIAAMAYGADKYIGFDPNVNLREGHEEMIRRYGDKERYGYKERYEDKERYRVIYQPFECGHEKQEELFDLCFSSPPYFDYEKYSHNPEYASFEDWMKRFLLASLKKAWGWLENGGYLAIHIADIPGHRIAEPMNLFIHSRLHGAKYVGVIGVEGSRNKVFPIWVWKKAES